MGRIIEALSKDVRQNPNDADPLVERGVAFGLNGQYEKAFADFDEVIRLDPDNHHAIRNRAATMSIKRPES